MAAEVLVHFVESGYCNLSGASDIPSGEGRNFSAEFSVPFPSTPSVMLTPHYTESAPSWVGEFSVGVIEKTTTGFSARCINNGSDSHHIAGVYWLAVL